MSTNASSKPIELIAIIEAITIRALAEILFIVQRDIFCTYFFSIFESIYGKGRKALVILNTRQLIPQPNGNSKLNVILHDKFSKLNISS